MLYLLLVMNMLLLSSSINKIPNFIKNANLPSCINCVYFIDDKTNYPYDQLSDNKYGKCKLFGHKDIVTGELENIEARYCRLDEQLCGKYGKYFESKYKS